MRGNELCEDILSVVVIMLILPIAAGLLFMIGVSLLYASPLILIALMIGFVVWLKRRPKPRIRPGRVKFTIPKPLAAVSMVIAKVLLGILVMAAYLWFMVNIPIGWALIITFCIVGFATGKKLNS